MRGKDFILQCRQSRDEAGGKVEKSNLAKVKTALNAVKSTLMDHLQEMEQKSLCVICEESPRRYTYVPCGHFAVCFFCEQEWSVHKTCPICRTEVTSVLRTFV